MLEKRKNGIAVFVFCSLFFMLCMWIFPHPDGQYRIPKIYFFLTAFAPFVAYCLIEDRRWRPFIFFIPFAMFGMMRFQFKWSFFTMEIFFLWLMAAATLEKIDYEDLFLKILYVVSIIWVVHGTFQWFDLDPITRPLDPVTGHVNTSIADPVIAFIGNPTWFGATTGMAIPLVLLRRGGILVAGGLFIVTIMTDSSGGVLTAIVSILSLIIFLTPGKKKYLWILGFIALLVITYYVYPMRPIYGSGGFFDENFRFRAWKDAWEYTKAAKWMGWGFGSWLEIFPRLTAAKYHGAVWLQGHNEYVQNYFETGIIGMIFMAWVFWNVFFSKIVDRRGYYYFAALLAISANALVNFCWHLPVTAVMTLVCLNRFFFYSEPRSYRRLWWHLKRRIGLSVFFKNTKETQ